MAPAGLQSEPLSVTLLVREFPRISQTYVFDKVVGMLSRGIRTKIISFKPSKTEMYREWMHRLDSPLFTHECRPWQLDSKASWISVLPLIARLCTSQPARTMQWLQTIGATRSAESLPARIVKYLPFLEEKCGVLHFELTRLIDDFPLLLDLWEKAITVSIHQIMDLSQIPADRQARLRKLFARAEGVQPTSAAAAEPLYPLGLDPKKVSVVHPSLDSTLFPDPGPRPDRPVKIILTVARLVHNKDYPTALRAIRLLANKRDDFRYRIVGGGDEEASIKKCADDLGLGEVVTFVGRPGHSEVAAELRGADLFLLASYFEGFGRVLTEAQACRLPVVATAVGGIPEAVHAGESALLVPPHSPEALADALEKILDDYSLRSSMGQVGRDVFENGFTLEIQSQLFETFYRKAALAR